MPLTIFPLILSYFLALRRGHRPGRLGVRLFERGRDGYAPTAAGEEAIATAARTLDTLAELERRLRSRNTDAPEVIDRRLRVARDELRHYQEYDYIIVNDDLDRAYDVLRSVYVSETFRCARQRAAAEAVLSGQQVLNIGGRAVTGPEGA